MIPNTSKLLFSILLVLLMMIMIVSAHSPWTVPRGGGSGSGLGWFQKSSSWQDALHKEKNSIVSAFGNIKSMDDAKKAATITKTAASKLTADANKEWSKEMDRVTKKMKQDRKQALSKLEAETKKLRRQTENQKAKMQATMDQLKKRIKELEAKTK